MATVYTVLPLLAHYLPCNSSKIKKHTSNTIHALAYRSNFQFKYVIRHCSMCICPQKMLWGPHLCECLLSHAIYIIIPRACVTEQTLLCDNKGIGFARHSHKHPGPHRVLTTLFVSMRFYVIWTSLTRRTPLEEHLDLTMWSLCHHWGETTHNHAKKQPLSTKHPRSSLQLLYQAELVAIRNNKHERKVLLFLNFPMRTVHALLW